tara:strand:+ start:88 stop:780 length:693 start_codon:yes stop_codon:yes gene_type:complete
MIKANFCHSSDVNLSYNEDWKSEAYEWRRTAAERYNLDWVTQNGLEHSTTEERELSESSEIRKGLYGNFQLVWLKNIDRLMDMLPDKVSIREYSLIDVGCGSGISTIYFRRYYDFKDVSGFDFRKNLVDASQLNLVNFNRKRNLNYKIGFFRADALKVKLTLDRPCIIFMFNPFNYEVASKFISNNFIFSEVQEHIIALSNDIWLPSLIDEFPKVRIVRNPEHNLSLCKL